MRKRLYSISLIIFVGIVFSSSEFQKNAIVNSSTNKMELWNNQTGPHLRGANIYQRRVYPELDGEEFMGSSYVGPPFTQQDFNALADLGANYVNISHPGLFSENPPYILDKNIRDNLDRLLQMAAKADMYVVISFRTGPGRSEFTFFWGEDGDWFDASYYNDQVWKDNVAQDAWATMWEYTAERYRDDPVVAGYDLMVEPNSNDVWLDIWEQDEFYSQYANTKYDWNIFFPQIISAIRRQGSQTPVLVGGLSYSAVGWLSYIKPSYDQRTVYTAHQYEPFVYTHQEPPLNYSYPGVFDTNWDGTADQFNRQWLADLLVKIDDYITLHGVSVAVNEFGVVRWEPGAAEFMNDQMGLFEEKGLNYALWVWETSWNPYAEEVNAFNFRHGPDPESHSDVVQSDLIDTIKKYWNRNVIRPSSNDSKRIKEIFIIR